MKYLGHSGRLTGFSISPEDDRRTVLTSARDGICRLYDVREPLPGLMIDMGLQMEHCPAALYVHAQGVSRTSSPSPLSLFLSLMWLVAYHDQ